MEPLLAELIETHDPLDAATLVSRSFFALAKVYLTLERHRDIFRTHLIFWSRAVPN